MRTAATGAGQLGSVGGTRSSNGAELLSRLSQQVAEAQEPRFAAGYDLEASLDRYQAWLREYSEVASGTLVAAGAATSVAFAAAAPAERTG